MDVEISTRIEGIRVPVAPIDKEPYGNRCYSEDY